MLQLLSPPNLSSAELTASHKYARPHEVLGQTFHGGFLNDGKYAPPRTLNRTPAIRAWSTALEARGWPLVDCSQPQRQTKVYPNLGQQRFLFKHNLRQSFWNELTVIAVNEGRGEAMCYVQPCDLQGIIDEDITASIAGHLWKGLFWAHGVDEAGDRGTPRIGGHKQMWFAARDLLLGKDAFPSPPIPRMHSRPKAEGQEAPFLPPNVEKLIESCMAVLLIECRAYPHFQLCLDLCGEPEGFDRPEENVRLAGEIIARIREDEASHVAYLQGLFSEFRSFTFRDGSRKSCKGFELLDPIWERQLAWPDAAALSSRRAEIRSVISHEAQEKFGPIKAQHILEEFDGLADG